MSDTLALIRDIVRDVRADYVPDSRVDVFEARARMTDGRPAVAGETTLRAAADDFQRRIRDADIDADLRIRVLPDRSLQPATEALVRAPIAPVYRRPTMNSTMLTQYAMGNRLTLLSRRRRFWRIRGEDGHIGWVHRGYLARGEPRWALGWERAEGGEPVVSLGAELLDEADRVFARLPWGARVVLHAGGRVRLPDGRAGRLGTGELVPADRLADRFPARGESITRTARRWIGAPYLWGGVTPCGVDCSGLVQSVYWIHGIALPRDSDMQALLGASVEPGPDFEALRPGDLLFFAEDRRVNHVALSLGSAHIVHASASNGGVEVNDMGGDRELEAWLRDIFVGARRLLPD